MGDKKRLYIIGGGVLGLIVVIVLVMNIFNQSSKKSSSDMFQNEEIIPTVDSSVVATVEESTKRGEISISIQNAPDGTQTADLELTYNRERQTTDEGDSSLIPDGAIASCEFKNGSRNCEKDGITLGTCSSGVCRYHKVVGKVKLSILFSGSYGKKAFEKEYAL